MRFRLSLLSIQSVYTLLRSDNHGYAQLMSSRIRIAVSIVLVNPSRKVFYHFAIRTIINEILIIKDRPTRACIPRGEAHGEKKPPSIA